MKVIHLVSNKVWGGGEKYALDLCSSLIDEGIETTVFSRGIEAVDSHFSKKGIPLHNAPLGGPLDFVSPFKLSRHIRNCNDGTTIIHVHNFKDAATAIRTKKLSGCGRDIKIVCTRHLVKQGGTSARWRRLYENIDRIIFVSELARNVFLSSNPIVDDAKLTVVHNGVSVPAKYSSLSFKSMLDSEVRILFAGRIAPEKGVEILIKSLQHLKDIPLRLIISGDGTLEYKKQLNVLADSLGVKDKIEWKGFVEDVFGEIINSDICVVPTIARESFGLSVVEAMSQGKPVITTSNGAQKEIITNWEDGILVSPSSSEELANSIRELSNNPALRERIGKKAYATFENRFSYNKFYEAIKSVYDSLA